VDAWDLHWLMPKSRPWHRWQTIMTLLRDSYENKRVFPCRKLLQVATFHATGHRSSPPRHHRGSSTANDEEQRSIRHIDKAEYWSTRQDPTLFNTIIVAKQIARQRSKATVSGYTQTSHQTRLPLGSVRWCLQQGDWHRARRHQQIQWCVHVRPMFLCWAQLYFCFLKQKVITVYMGESAIENFQSLGTVLKGQSVVHRYLKYCIQR
jgi:hypothetical protein